jgi:nicotinate phosphoribosyltransferase
LKDLKKSTIVDKNGNEVEYVQHVLDNLKKLYPNTPTHQGELAAFIAYSQASPKGFLALVDTYNVFNSGIPNFLAVATTLYQLTNHLPLGIRLDSGDLAGQSKWARDEFRRVSKEASVPFEKLGITASNDISESSLLELNAAGHEIDTFGIGTHLVTCKAQPALGGVFKLVSIDGVPRIKLSQELEKVTIPGQKSAYRFHDAAGHPLMDILSFSDEPAPIAGQEYTFKDAVHKERDGKITPATVEPLHDLVWDGKLIAKERSLTDIRSFCTSQLEALGAEHKAVDHPRPYHVALSPNLYSHMYELWEQSKTLGTVSQSE